VRNNKSTHKKKRIGGREKKLEKERKSFEKKITNRLPNANAHAAAAAAAAPYLYQSVPKA
jgi:hypothetical protein